MGSSLTGVTALRPCSRDINPCSVLLQPRKTRLDIADWEVKNQIKQKTHLTRQGIINCTLACFKQNKCRTGLQLMVHHRIFSLFTFKFDPNLTLTWGQGHKNIARVPSVSCDQQSLKSKGLGGDAFTRKYII